MMKTQNVQILVCLLLIGKHFSSPMKKKLHLTKIDTLYNEYLVVDIEGLSHLSNNHIHFLADNEYKVLLSYNEEEDILIKILMGDILCMNQFMMRIMTS